MRKVVYIVNADWYFCLHWLDRANYFKSLFDEIHVITPLTQDSKADALRLEGFIVHEVDLCRRGIGLISAFREFRQIFKHLRFIRADLLNSITVKPNIYAGLFSVLNRTPAVMSVTGLGINFTSAGFRSYVVRNIIVALYWFISKANPRSVFIFENNKDLNYLSRRLGLDKSRVHKTPGAGVDGRLFKYSPPPRFSGQIKILFAARLLRSKGLEYLIEALEVLRAGKKDAVLYIAGIIDDDSEDSLCKTELSALQNIEGIHYLGQVDNMVQLIESCHLACLPTYYGEGIPRFLIEAAAIGRPIITTHKGGCEEICSNKVNGYLVRSKNSSDIVDAVNSYFLDPKLLIIHGLDSRRIFKESFQNEAVFFAYDQAYKSVSL